MTGAIICFIIVLIAIEQGQIDMVVIFGIIGVICFLCRKKEDPHDRVYSEQELKQQQQEKLEQQKKELPSYRATPSAVQKYRNHPITKEIYYHVMENGAYENFNFDKDGFILRSSRSSGGTTRYYSFDFRAHGYKPPTQAEQEAILIALTGMLPNGDSYTISYAHREDELLPLYYQMSTTAYKECRWDDASKQWFTLRSH